MLMFNLTIKCLGMYFWRPFKIEYMEQIVKVLESKTGSMCCFRIHVYSI